MKRLRQSQVHLLFIMHANVDSVHLHGVEAKYCKVMEMLYMYFSERNQSCQIAAQSFLLPWWWTKTRRPE